MFKINKNKIIGLVSGMSLVASLGLYGCDSKSNNNSESMKIEFDDAENTSGVAVYHNGDVSIIIPFRSYFSDSSGFVSFDTGFNYNHTMFSTDDITIFSKLGDMSAYDQALRFAEAISDKVYLYSDVVNGSLVNLVVGDKIGKEIGVR